MKEHELKVWPEFFDALLDESKPFEFRKNDRDYKVGDALWLREFEPGNEGYEGMDVVQPGYTGREIRGRKITYVLKGFRGMDPDTVILGLSSPAFDALAKERDGLKAKLADAESLLQDVETLCKMQGVPFQVFNCKPKEV